MKRFSLLVAFLIIGCVVYGQTDHSTKNSIRIGINRAFFGSGDIIGPSISAEYSYSINNYLAITPRMMSGSAHKFYENYFFQASSFGTSLSVKVTPLPYSFERLKFDVGLLYHRFIHFWGEIDHTSSYGSYISTEANYSINDLKGFIGSIQFNLIDRNKMESGLRFDMLTSLSDGYFNCDSWQIGFFVGIKF